MSIVLETDRLMLRPFRDTAEDVDQVLGIDNDPEVMRFINGGRLTTREMVLTETLPRFLRHYPCIDAPGFWAAQEKGTETFLGWFEFRPVDDGSSAVVELGYRLGRAAWGRGFATEGSRALIRKGFTELGVQRVTANTMAANVRSRHVMEKLGLTFVRTYFEVWPDMIAGAELGDVEYALTRSDWEAQDTD